MKKGDLVVPDKKYYEDDTPVRYLISEGVLEHFTTPALVVDDYEGTMSTNQFLLLHNGKLINRFRHGWRKV